MATTIPLFPLNTVLFPEGVLPLRIFERRYLDLISDCLKQDTGFGVCLIRRGKEVGDAPEIFKVGTYCKIVDWDRGEDGLLGITTQGTRRFRVISRRLSPGGLLEADVEWLDDDECSEITPEHDMLADILKKLADKYFPQYSADPDQFDDALWLGYRLSECLPLHNAQKQTLLEVDDPGLRLDYLRSLFSTKEDE
ncbi:MAG: LON peptidase substrate-binding domain-containing protein [Pseudomonadota bacterium]